MAAFLEFIKKVDGVNRTDDIWARTVKAFADNGATDEKDLLEFDMTLCKKDEGPVEGSQGYTIFGPVVSKDGEDGECKFTITNPIKRLRQDLTL